MEIVDELMEPVILGCDMIPLLGIEIYGLMYDVRRPGDNVMAETEKYSAVLRGKTILMPGIKLPYVEWFAFQLKNYKSWSKSWHLC